jgi:hypothetical protein
MAIYRVLVRNTGSFQPRNESYWSTKVLYCGTSLEDARVAYLASVVCDGGSSFGCPAIRSVIEEFESEPTEIDSTEALELEDENV